MSVVVERRTITPNEAAMLLARGGVNRSLSRSHVARIARDIASGNWLFDASPIRILDDGSIGDGQHRLSACVMAGLPIDTLVVCGLRRESMALVDSGRKRTLSDRLHMRGVRNSGNVATVLNGLWSVAYGDESASPTSSEALRLFARYPHLADFVSASALNGGIRFMVRPCMVFGFIGKETGHVDASAAWVRVFQSGIPSRPDGCPAHALREALLRMQQARQNIGGQSVAKVMRLSCRAWIAMRNDAPLRIVRQVDRLGLPEWSWEHVT